MISVYRPTHIGGCGGRRGPFNANAVRSPTGQICWNLMTRFRRSDLRLSESDHEKEKKKKRVVVAASRSRKMLMMKTLMNSAPANIDIDISPVQKHCGVAVGMAMAALLIPNPMNNIILPNTNTILLARFVSFTYRVFVAYNFLEEITYIVSQVFSFLHRRAAALGLGLGRQPESTTTVLHIQIALLGTAKLIVKSQELYRGAMHSITELRHDLLNHKQDWISAISYWTLEKSKSKALKDTGELYEKESARRSTILNERDPNSMVIDNGQGYLVVKIIMAIQGTWWIPSIRPEFLQFDLEYALQQLGHLDYDETKSLYIIWTPLYYPDVLSKQEFVQYYPHLEPVAVQDLL